MCSKQHGAMILWGKQGSKIAKDTEESYELLSKSQNGDRKREIYFAETVVNGREKGLSAFSKYPQTNYTSSSGNARVNKLVKVPLARKVYAFQVIPFYSPRYAASVVAILKSPRSDKAWLWRYSENTVWSTGGHERSGNAEGKQYEEAKS